MRGFELLLLGEVKIQGKCSARVHHTLVLWQGFLFLTKASCEGSVHGGSRLEVFSGHGPLVIFLENSGIIDF